MQSQANTIKYKWTNMTECIFRKQDIQHWNHEKPANHSNKTCANMAPCTPPCANIKQGKTIVQHNNIPQPTIPRSDNRKHNNKQLKCNKKYLTVQINECIVCTTHESLDVYTKENAKHWHIRKQKPEMDSLRHAATPNKHKAQTRNTNTQRNPHNHNDTAKTFDANHKQIQTFVRWARMRSRPASKHALRICGQLR